jgi:hypothetical protein
MNCLSNAVALSGKSGRPDLQFGTFVGLFRRGCPWLKGARLLGQMRSEAEHVAASIRNVSMEERGGRAAERSSDFGGGSGRLPEFGGSHPHVSLENVVEG